jgi:hypothetical protein
LASTAARNPQFLLSTLAFLLSSGLPLALGERETLGLFPACPAFLNVVSTLAVSHKTSTVTYLSRRGNSQAGPLLNFQPRAT